MKLPGSLFVKIFVGFWLVTTAILASWMLTDNYFRSLPGSEPPAGERHMPGPPHRFVLRLIYDLQHTPHQELPALLHKAREDQEVEIYLLDAEGDDLLGRKVSTDVQQLAAQLDGGRRRAVGRDHRRLLLAHEIYRPDEGPLRAIFQFQRPRRVLGWLGSNLWLRLGLAVLISGLVCYLLSRMMTGRLEDLRGASRRLARGELDTRLQVRGSGGDETDELARDFNSMAEQLQERVQAQKHLLADVSHELRSPLARLRIALALAQEDRDHTGKHLQRIEQEAERLEELIGQLLSSQAGNIKLDAQSDLVPLLRKLCDDANFEGTSGHREVVFTSAVTEALVATSGDLLHKSFENILRNALTHTPEHSRVSVSLERDDDQVTVRITDQGPGVPEAQLDRIFDEFYRVDSARTRESGGYGLGLSIARRVIQGHGGRIRAENTGSGLAVSVTLPTARTSGYMT